MQQALTSSLDGWLVDHPLMMQLLQILSWGTNHPIISAIALLFIIALLWNIVKALGRLIEAASLSILRVPLTLIAKFIKFVFISFSKLTLSIFKQLTGKQTPEISTLVTVDSPKLEPNHQQRLAEISARLAEIQVEQQQLLQEATNLINLEKTE